MIDFAKFTTDALFWPLMGLGLALAIVPVFQLIVLLCGGDLPPFMPPPPPPPPPPP